VEEHSFSIHKTTRYYTCGDISKATRLLVVLHGYGQSAFFFLKKFEFLVAKGYFIVAPEGMHRFYLEGTSGRVGASWMTREARLADIQDNFNYLEGLVSKFTDENSFLSVDVLGFSQGAATATRWFQNSRFSFRALVLWASVFPEDVHMDFSTKSGTNCFFVLGMQDPYFDIEIEKETLNTYEKLKFEIIRFDGKHEMNQEVLDSLY
jgi:predicted esterase